MATATATSRNLLTPTHAILASYKNANSKIRGSKGSRVHFFNQNIPTSGVLPAKLNSPGNHEASRRSAAFSAAPLKCDMLTSIQLLRGGHQSPHLKPKARRQRGSLVPIKAFKDDYFTFRVPLVVEKPEWYWRTFACVPYLIAMQISDAGYYLYPFLQHHEAVGDLIYFIPGAIKRWPPWFVMVYCYFGYIGIVKNKDWPHYFRFHVMMGMLLETAMQIIWYTSNFFPLIHYNGRFGMHYWAAIGFAYIFILLECVRCALRGTYAQIPFVSDSAFIHTLFHIGGYQRPF